MAMSEKSGLRIKGVDELHFYVRDLERSRAHYVERLGFAEVAVSSPSFEREQRARASLLQAGGVRFVFMQPLTAVSEGQRFLSRHPEGVGRIVLEVEDVQHAYELLLARGATPVSAIQHAIGEHGAMCWFDIVTALGDTHMRFVQYQAERSLFPGLVRTGTRAANRFGISQIDHITSNFLTLQPALMWMQEVLGFERYWGIEFHTSDIAGSQGEGSGLKSVVMWDPASGIKFANNEPAAPAFHASQIYRFCEEHRGAGVQHVALSVDSLVDAVRDMRGLGVSFMPTPASYYELLPARLVELGVARLDEPLTELAELEILVDGDGPERYLLQIFLREAAGLFADPNAGPLFIELIQRKGDQGFGAGNFRALFESIERQQARDEAA
jgi:4-hydroxyphenylpyruvate dioxygenase